MSAATKPAKKSAKKSAKPTAAAEGVKPSTALKAEEAHGRAVRRDVPRSSQGPWEAPRNRPDPIAILEAQALTRVPELVPIRYGRMAASEFAFLRGAPAIMAADLASTPNTGLMVQLCGDAHLVNFGFYASPERTLLFDLNDFDETLPGPFEWDVKRLAASVAVASRQNGHPEHSARDAAQASARGYREHMRELAARTELDVWYERVDTADLLADVRKRNRAEAEQELSKARRRTSLQALEKLTEPGPDGEPRIKHDPPLVQAIGMRDLGLVQETFEDFLRSMQEDRRVLLERFKLVDAALKVVGVGSVGTRCFVALLAGTTVGDPLMLQIKEAEQSVLAAHLAPSRHRHQGQRVVAGQRLLQAASDIFLGWATGPAGRFFYWRQLRDMKGAVEVEKLDAKMLLRYAEVCGRTLARAHARSGPRAEIADYLGRSDAFDRAIASWAVGYGDQTHRDHKALLAAIAQGRVEAVSDV
ncbi:DUF2252 domain-containing protein [Streptacidiphilus pinicola]|uniref:DUF2252 domain-containing protein n=1 Tax=Streptacidiphilus pinicola TaxID=2219663 RepID=A0A2X0I6X0_9ACTN|nr:DUF2252 domain-containing protein [Streptacidiphilus pinicola]RAG80722.1 DUF2252 domain-containing protein [Streptacidiphilus pinicola]